MPEGPEVKRNGTDLAASVSGKKISQINLISGRYTKKSPFGLEEYITNLPDTVIGVGVHGKFIYILTSSENNIWSTLGMTGRWTTQKGKHTRIELVLEDSKVYFNDIRNFGTFKVVYGKNKLIEKLSSLGPDMLSEDVENSVFISRLRKKNHWNVCKALMDQSVVSGIGNYIKAEALWLSSISPHRQVSEISDDELKVLNSATKQIMRTSYDSGGATFLTHKNFGGTKGDYSSRFLCYNRETDAEGNLVEKVKTPDGRTTYWSPKKQG